MENMLLCFFLTVAQTLTLALVGLVVPVGFRLRGIAEHIRNSSDMAIVLFNESIRESLRSMRNAGQYRELIGAAFGLAGEACSRSWKSREKLGAFLSDLETGLAQREAVVHGAYAISLSVGLCILVNLVLLALTPLLGEKGGGEVWTFVAKAPGPTHRTLEYVRPCEQGQAPIHTHAIHVTITRKEWNRVDVWRTGPVVILA